MMEILKATTARYKIQPNIRYAFCIISQLCQPSQCSNALCKRGRVQPLSLTNFVPSNSIIPFPEWPYQASAPKASLVGINYTQAAAADSPDPQSAQTHRSAAVQIPSQAEADATVYLGSKFLLDC